MSWNARNGIAIASISALNGIAIANVSHVNGIQKYSAGTNGLLTSLISYWKMDEASGDAIDAHGSNDLTDNNTVGSAAGKIGNSRDFETSNSEYFSHADNSDLSTGDIDFTFNCWINIESVAGANRRILNKINTAVTVLEYQLFYQDASSENRIRWEVFDGSGSVGAVNGGSLSTSTWYMITCWHDATTNQVGICVNNGTPATTSTSGAPADTSADFTIGSLGALAGTYWDGLIDEVGFWKKVLSPTDIANLYNSGSGLAYSSFD